MGRLSLALPLSPITISSLMSVIKIAIMSLSNRERKNSFKALLFILSDFFSLCRRGNYFSKANTMDTLHRAISLNPLKTYHLCWTFVIHVHHRRDDLSILTKKKNNASPSWQTNTPGGTKLPRLHVNLLSLHSTMSNRSKWVKSLGPCLITLWKHSGDIMLK